MFQCDMKRPASKNNRQPDELFQRYRAMSGFYIPWKNIGHIICQNITKNIGTKISVLSKLYPVVSDYSVTTQFSTEICHQMKYFMDPF